ncbi:MAG: type II secretion system protein [Bacilli bacterium]|nr:type II secretion system protein [Bacilli bacterium]
MKKRNRGFTLVEVIVTIVILGITTTIALPIVSNLQSQLNNNKYKVYNESLESSAKLYTDSYDYDMFGRKLQGCVKISYDELSNKKLLKDIELDKNISCNNNDTYVIVIKTNDTYTYQSSLKCTDENGNVVYEKSDVHNDCPETNDENHISIVPSPDSQPTPVNSLNEKIRVNSSYGFCSNISFKYQWIGEGVENTDATLYEFKNAESTIINSTHIDTKSIKIPNKSGTYTLKIVPEHVCDAQSNNFYTSNYYEPDKKFIFDFVPPTISVNSDINKSTNNVTLSLTDNMGVSKYAFVTDDEPSNSDWKNIDSCSDKKNCSMTISVPEGNYNFFVKDQAGNKANVTKEIKIDRPTAPVITGGADGWYSTNRIIWVSTKSTTIGKIKKYQYCVSTTKSTGSCSWTDLYNNTDGVSNNGLDVAYYHSNNIDLINAFGGSVPSLNTHYTQYGNREGRAISDPNADDPDNRWIRDSQSFSYEGDRYVYFRAVTEGGLVSAASNPQHLKIDKSKPKVSTFNVASTRSFNSRYVTVTVAGTDTGGSGINKVCYSLTNNINNCNWKGTTSSGSFSVTFSAGEGSGTNYTVYAFVSDNAGNNSTSSSKGYRLYSNCTNKKLNCNYGWDDGSRPCTVGHGNGWGKKGRYCYYFDVYTGARCNSELRTCPCDSWCDRDGMTNIPFDPAHQPQYNKYWQGYGGSCVRPFCGSVLCENDACRPANAY